MSNATLAERFPYGRVAIDVARIFMSGIFLVAGSAKLVDVAGTAAHMTAAGIPNSTTLAVVAGLAEVLGGLAVATGILARIAAIALVVYLIPVTLIFHHFWDLSGQE